MRKVVVFLVVFLLVMGVSFENPQKSIAKQKTITPVTATCEAHDR